ncbi:MAG: TonB-dependent receptor [Ginsengibacter sp.]
MKSLFLFVPIFLLSNYVFSQENNVLKSEFSIKGRLMDSISREPFEYGTISLFLEGVAKPVNGTIADSKGNFLVDNVKAGNYKLVAEFIGYKPFIISNIHVNEKNPQVEIKDIYLFSKTIALTGITITANTKVVENRIDKLVFNVERDLTSQVGAATDILRKVPQVSVDIDGNVELAGSTSVKFLINGKPSSAFGSNIADVLQSIPASQIKSIEVITSPGAKYDAQGVGGIINIILKQNNSRGVNGNISLSAGTRQSNGSFNFNARKGSFGMNAFISTNIGAKVSPTYNSDRNTNDTSSKTNILLHQDAISQFQRGGYQTGIGFDWDMYSTNSITGSISYNHFGNNGNGSTNQNQIINDKDGNLISGIQTLINQDNQFKFHNIDASLNYKKTFAKEEQALEISVNTSVGNRTSTSNNYQFNLPLQQLYYSTKSKNPGTESETEMTADYTHPINEKVIFGVGGKYSLYNISSYSNVFKLDASTNQYITDPILSNSLDYRQKVYAFYSEISFPFFSLFDAKTGVRYERTEINAFYSNAQQQKNIPGYNTIVPSIFLSKKIGENGLLKLSYSKRIERPDYRDLNPFINTNDPKNLSMGNSNLKPEIGHRLELGYNVDIKNLGSVMLSLFYRMNDQDIQSFIIYYPTFKVGDTTYTNVAVSTRENVGKENNFGVNLYSDFKLIPKLNLRTNLSFYQRHIVNQIDKGFNSDGFLYRIKLNASYQFTNTLAGEFFGNFNSAKHEVQGTFPSFMSYSMAIRKQFWNKKASLALTASNPFKKDLEQKTSLIGPNFTSTNVRYIPFRSFGINFTWKFGRLEFKKVKDGMDDNAPTEAPSGR